MPDEPTPAAENAAPIGPDGTPFDPSRWSSYVQHTKAEKDELRQKLADAEGVWEDDEALAARLRETRPQWFEEGEEEEPEDQEFDDPRDQRIAVLEQRLGRIEPWQQTIDQERGEQQFKRDLKDELGDLKVPEKATTWIKDRTAALGNNRKALKQAIEEFRDLADEVRGPVRKDAPTPPPAGKAGDTDPTKIKDPAARRTARRARIAAQVEAGMQQQ